MIISTIPASNCNPQTIVIGRRGTYDTMQIAFDLSYLIENYGSGTAVLAVKRSQDTSAYPAVVTQEDATLLWTVNETDTAYVGSGECQLMWYVDGGLAKTIIYPMVVMRDILSTAEEPPDGYENWIERLTELGAETQQNAQNAAQSASDAEQSATDAGAAKDAANEAVLHYPKIENGYWYVWDVTAQAYQNTNIKAEGEDGYSPEVTITTITGGHRVTITDKNHPQGQSFDVLDGHGGGGSSDYADLSNKPKINNVELDGNKTAHDLGLAAQTDIPTVPVQSVNGKTGAVNLASGDIGYDETATYQAGSVGAELSNQSRHLSDKAPVIINTASGDVASFADGADGMQMCKVVGTIATPEGGSGWTECKIYNEPHNSLLPQLVNWQQKLNNALSSWAKSTYVGTREEDGYIFVRTSSSSQRSYYISQSTTILQDHVCIAFVTITNLVGNRAYTIGGQNYTLDKNIETNVGFCVKYATDQSAFTVRKDSYAASSGDIFKFKNIMLFDLTEMLGAEKAEYVYGLEQSRTGAGVEWFKTLFPKDFYDYSVSAEEQVTVSDVNDEQYRSLSIAFTDPSTGDPITVNNGTITLNEDGSADLVTSDDPSASYHWQNVGELNTFYGSNGVWINTGSILSCEYRADTKLYVDALTARDTDITESIASVENGATSTQAYAQGAYFWHDTKFCKALTAIASGATFTLGTNYQETTVAAELLAAQN